MSLSHADSAQTAAIGGVRVSQRVPGGRAQGVDMSTPTTSAAALGRLVVGRCFDGFRSAIETLGARPAHRGSQSPWNYWWPGTGSNHRPTAFQVGVDQFRCGPATHHHRKIVGCDRGCTGTYCGELRPELRPWPSNGRSTNLVVMSARPVVDLDVAPYAAELDCWGQTSVGWWALVTWCESVVQEKRMMRRSAIMCSAWAAARQVRQGLARTTARCHRSNCPTTRRYGRSRPTAVRDSGGRRMVTTSAS